MIKKLIMVLLIVSMVVVFGACGQKSTPADTQEEVQTPAITEEGKIAEIKSSGKLVLGTSAGYPPYEFHKLIDGEDKIVGFDIDIAKKLADDLGVELEIVDMKFEGLLPALVTDDIDIIIAGMVATPERAESVDFTIPYYEAVHKMVIKLDNKDLYKEPEDLAGLKIGAQKATTQEGLALEMFPKSEYVGISKVPDLIMELKNGKLDAVLLAEPVAKANVSHNSDLYMAETVLGLEPGACIAVNKGNEDLLDFMNDSLEKMIKAGEIEKFINDATILADE